MNWKLKRKDYFIIAVLISTLITFISYPGYFYDLDSYRRWEYALAIIEGQAANVTNEYSLFPQIVMALCYKLTENYAAYTFLQSVTFLFTTYCVLDLLIEKYCTIAVILVTMFPPILIRGVQMETAVGAIIGINIYILLLMRDNSESMEWKPSLKNICKSISYLLGLFLAGVIVFGYRQNAFTIIPVILFFLVKGSCNGWKKSKVRCMCNIVTVLLSAAFVMNIPTIYGITDSSDASAIGVLWDNISALEQVKDVEKYENCLDWMGGSTKEAIKLNTPDNIYGFNEAIPAWYARDKNNAKRIKKQFFQLCMEEPDAVLKAKLIRASYVLGISQPLVDNDIHYNDLDKMWDLGMRDTKLRYAFMNNYQQFSNWFVLMRIPWIVFLLVGIMSVCLYKKMKTPEKKIAILLYGLSVFYYGAFLVNAQSCEFRYFFPAFYLLVILLIFNCYVILQKYKKEVNAIK